MDKTVKIKMSIIQDFNLENWASANINNAEELIDWLIENPGEADDCFDWPLATEFEVIDE